MLKDILKERKESVYKVSKATGIAYTTLNELVIEKTDIKKATSETLYRLSKYFGISMEKLYEMEEENIIPIIYIYNSGRDIIVESETFRYQYLGPKSLVSFKKINVIKGNVIHINTLYKINNEIVYEEEYIDLNDVLENDSYILESEYEVRLGSPKMTEKERLIDESLLISDNLAIKQIEIENIPDTLVEVVSMARTTLKAIIRLKDCAIVETNMSEAMQKRCIEAIRRNVEIIQMYIQANHKQMYKKWISLSDTGYYNKK